MMKDDRINIMYIAPCSKIGGAALSFLYLLENLDTSKYRPIVAVYSFVDPEYARRIEATGASMVFIPRTNSWLKIPPIQLGIWYRLTCPKRMINRFLAIVELVRLIKRLNIQIVHTNIAIIIEGAIAAKLTRTPHVWHIREKLGKSRNYLASFTSFIGDKGLIKLIDRLSTVVIVNSSHTIEPFKKYGDTSKVVLIHNGVNLEDFENREPMVRKEFGIPQTAPLVCMIGYINPIRRVEDFIKTASKVRDVIPEAKFLIVGRIDDECQDYYLYLKNLVSSLKLEGNIIFTGFRRDIPDILADVDVLVQPMIDGSWGRVVLEAMAAAKPVVAVETNLQSDFIVNGKTGIIVESPSKLADAVIKILKEPQVASMMGKQGRERVRKFFTNKVYAHKVQKVYDFILQPTFR